MQDSSKNCLCVLHYRLQLISCPVIFKTVQILVSHVIRWDKNCSCNFFSLLHCIFLDFPLSYLGFLSCVYFFISNCLPAIILVFIIIS